MPHLGLEYPFMMHGLLALSALHMANLQPNRHAELIAKAALHEQHALPVFRTALSNLTKENSHAVFAFSALVVHYAQAIAIQPADAEISGQSAGDILPAWFCLIRGMKSLLHKMWPWLEDGPFSSLFQHRGPPIDCTLNSDDDHFTALLPLFSLSSSRTAEKEEDLLICRAALQELRREAALPSSPHHTIGTKVAPLIWPIVVSEEYIQLVLSGFPEALVILAYFCVLLRQAESSWHLQHQAERILEAITQRLDMSWTPWLEWPRQRVCTPMSYPVTDWDLSSPTYLHSDTAIRTSKQASDASLACH